MRETEKLEGCGGRAESLEADEAARGWKREGERSANDNPAFCIYIIGSEIENNRILP